MAELAARDKQHPAWFVSGDFDGFFGLAIDNLIQFLLILGLCQAVLGFPVSLLLSRVLPGAALSILSVSVCVASTLPAASTLQ